VYRASNLERSQEFYAEVLGMTVLRWRSNLQSTPMETSLTMQFGDPLAMVDPNGAPAILELVYPYDTQSVDAGEGGAGRLVVAAGDLPGVVEGVPSARGRVVDASPDGDTAHVADPDGFELKLVAN